MNRQQIDLVRSSFALVQPHAPQVATLFYDHLFAADPSLRELFHGSIANQGERLMAMLAKAIGMLDRPTALMPVLRMLGSRHLGYGVSDRHYATVGAALLKTLEQGLGAALTVEVRDAWVDLYDVISRTMIEGAREPTWAA
jgi:hemoglobin-like flavoprotein